MNTSLSRLNGVFSFTLTALAVVTTLCYLSTAFKDRLVIGASVKPSPSYSISVRRVHSQETKMDHDLVDIQLEIIADFSSLFDWNTKQLFVYVVASYMTEKHPINEIVLWDKIILRGQPAVIQISSTSMEYHFLDHGLGLRDNQNVTLQLCWNVIPLAGQLPLIKSEQSRITLPSHYTYNK